MLALTALLVVSVPAFAAEPRPLPVYTGAEFKAIYDYAVENTLPNLTSLNGRYSITGNAELDDRIWEIALSRGYVLRPSASGELVWASGVQMQPGAARAWATLEPEARQAGMRFVISSAYRSPETQRQWFLAQLEGTSDTAINATLNWYSVPGTSKHHAGYALDFRYVDGTFGGFRNTPDYAWLSADNFNVPKRHGLIPSYPDDVENQGPRPEPWEFVWVGIDLIQCGLPQTLAVDVEGPASALLDEMESCPGGPEPVTVPSWLTP